MESVALLANSDGERAERSLPGLRSSLVRLLSSPDGAVRRNAIEALKGGSSIEKLSARKMT